MGPTGAIRVNTVNMGDTGSANPHGYSEFVYSQATYSTPACAATAPLPVAAVPRAVYNYLHFTNNAQLLLVTRPQILQPPYPQLPPLQLPAATVGGGGSGRGGGGGGRGDV